MRNLKRALSLTLASVMLLGMMVVGSSAAAGYDDVAETDNVEAIEVLQAIEVMVGDERGFGPERPVNRAEMAVVMAKLLSLDYNYYATSCPFNDVYDWARGYVGACAANKIVSGRGEGVYDPGATVTAVEAASMLMRALGYFQYANDVADGFELSTVRQGTIIGIFDDVGSSATEPMTRNQVAQMVLNALQSAVVEPDGNTINLTTPDGTVLTGKVNYVSVTSQKPFARAIGKVGATSIGSANDGYIVELGEQLYNGKLQLNDDIDPFNRPARKWEYDGKGIGTYVKKELMEKEYVGEVTGKDLYDLLGKSVIEDYELDVAIDGVTDPAIVRRHTGEDKLNTDFVFNTSDLNRNNKAAVGATGTGVLTQVFVDPDEGQDGKVWIAIINTYLARASQNYDSRREELPVTGYAIAKDGASGEYAKKPKNGAATTPFRLGAEEFPVVVDAKENDAFLFTVAEGEIQTFKPAEVLSGVQISSFKKGDNVVVDGTTYKFDTTAGFDPETLKDYTDLNTNAIINLKDLTYNVYLDQYGNLIGVEEVDAVKNYVFITAMDLNDSNLVNGVADARAIFLDGTSDTIRVNMAKSDIDYYKTGDTPGGYNKNSILNTWCTYTKSDSGVYTLKQVSVVDGTDAGIPGGTTSLAQYNQTNGSFDIDKKHITLKGKNGSTGDFAYVYGNEDTVYITAELDELVNEGGTWGVISDVDTYTVGAENVNLTVWSNAQAAEEAEDKGTITTPYASKGVYTLYDDDGIVIGAVVVGEDNGTAKNLVYVHSGDVNYEAYNGKGSSRAAGDGLYTWTRDVISDGEKITLTEVNDGDSDLAKMVKYRWYQIKTNGDGEVTGVYRLPTVTVDAKDADRNLKTANLKQFKDYALDWDNVFTLPDGAINDGKRGEITYTIQEGSSTILYFNEETITSRMRMNGRTLYVHTKDESGFIVSNNVKWLIQRWDSNKQQSYYDEGTGAASLKTMIDEINDRYPDGKAYEYNISAVIEGGIASSVVIRDDYNDYNRPETPSAGKGNVATVLDGSSASVDYNVTQSGRLQANFEYTAPEFAAPGATMTYTVNAYTKNATTGKNVLWDSTSGNVTVQPGEATGFVWRSGQGDFDTGVELTFEIVAESLSAVQIKYVAQGTNGADPIMDYSSDKTAKQVAVGANKGFKFEVKASEFQNSATAAFAITGGATHATMSGSLSNSKYEYANGVTVSGKDFVTVAIGPLTANDPTYKVDLSDELKEKFDTKVAFFDNAGSSATAQLVKDLGLHDDADAKLELATDSDYTAIAKDTETLVKLTAKVTVDTDYLNWDVTIVANGKAYTLKNANKATTGASVNIPLAKNTDLIITSITVAPSVAPLAITGLAKTDVLTYEVTFNNGVENASGAALVATTNITVADGSGSIISEVKHTAKSNTITVVLTRELAADDVITIVKDTAFNTNDPANDHSTNTGNKLGSTGNKLTVTATATDNVKITGTSLYYELGDAS